MASRYTYFGRDGKQQGVTGVLEADSPGHVADWLLGTGVTPVVIEAERTEADVRDVLRGLLGAGRIGTAELMLYSRQMATLMRAGVPMLRALAGLESSASNPALARLMRELRGGLDSGLELAQAMARRRDVFDDFYVAMVRVGETTGRLEEVFRALHHHLEFSKHMREQVKAALRYPSFVVGAMVVALVIINIVVIPAFAKVFENMGGELPLMTRILLFTSRFTLQWGWLLALALVAAFFALRSVLRTPAGRLAWDRLKLRLPIVGGLVRRGVLAQAVRSLALVVKSGVPLVQGITLSAQVVENAFVSARLSGMRRDVERGDTLLAACGRAGVFTPVVLQMVMVGEESGTLAEMLDEIGVMYQDEVEVELKGLSGKVEPILIFAMGAMVLVLALGVFMPMWEMGSMAKK